MKVPSVQRVLEVLALFILLTFFSFVAMSAYRQMSPEWRTIYMIMLLQGQEQ